MRLSILFGKGTARTLATAITITTANIDVLPLSSQEGQLLVSRHVSVGCG